MRKREDGIFEILTTKMQLGGKLETISAQQPVRPQTITLVLNLGLGRCRHA